MDVLGIVLPALHAIGDQVLGNVIVDGNVGLVVHDDGLGLGLLGVLSGNFILALIAVFIFFGAGMESFQAKAKTVLDTLRADPRIKLLFLTRLIPLCERNYNLVELGPRGTGKTTTLDLLNATLSGEAVV